MTSNSYSARVTSVRQLTNTVCEFALRIIQPTPFIFLPGQAVALSIPAPGFISPLIRYYSIASPPSQAPDLLLLVSMADQEAGSRYLLQQGEGSIVQLEGPVGTFHLREEKKREILFVATGTGIAPFRSMLYSLLDQTDSQAVRVLWGLRSEQDLFFQDEFKSLASRYPAFSTVTTLSRAEATWNGARGRVTKLVENLSSVEGLAVYVCGNQSMVNEVSEIVRQKGPCPIYREEFSPNP